jgi:hypothetical protein
MRLRVIKRQRGVRVIKPLFFVTDVTETVLLRLRLFFFLKSKLKNWVTNAVVLSNSAMQGITRPSCSIKAKSIYLAEKYKA